MRLVLTAFLFTVLLFISWFLWPLQPLESGVWTFYDRNGEVLYTEGAVNVGEATPNEWTLASLVALEDQRFYDHFGVDVAAVVRAGVQNTMAGEIVSGASTLTMQVARLRFMPEANRNWWYKVRQVVYAWKLEWHYSKAEILEQYLQLASFGHGTVGINAAAHHYFAKSAAQLSPAESVALLVTLQNPSLYNPLSSPVLSQQRQTLAWERLWSAGVMSREEVIYWQQEPLVLVPPALKSIVAPHYLFWLKQNLLQSHDFLRLQDEVHVYTTLDKADYEAVLQIVKRTIERIGQETHMSNGAVVVLDENNQIRVMVGSMDYFDTAIDGAVNLAVSPRQTGSTLKPLLYAWAVGEGLSPASGLKDLKTIFPSGYLPRNFDVNEENGLVRWREALANSYNIAAVDLLQQMGVADFARFLDSVGIPLSESADHYGLSLILGSGEASLLDLTQAYSVFTHQGWQREPQAVLRVEDGSGKILYEPVAQRARRVLPLHAAEWGQHVLSDYQARWKNFTRGNSLELPFPSGAKTGTSQGFRDNWVIGFSPHFTVGVWMGNADGSPLYSTSGLEGAGPVWQAVMQRLHPGGKARAFDYQSDRTSATWCRRPGESDCSEMVTVFLRPDEMAIEERVANEVEFEIFYPAEGDVFVAGSDLLVQWRGTRSVTFWLNGEVVEGPIISHLKLGEQVLKIQSSSGEIDQVRFRVDSLN